jgi:hypothetical protein
VPAEHFGLKAPFLAILTFFERIFGPEAVPKMGGFKPSWPIAIALAEALSWIDDHTKGMDQDGEYLYIYSTKCD